MRLLAVALFALLALPQPAHAEWQRIETREFALQADMEPEAIRALGLQLLDLDRLLRELFGVTGPGRGRRVEMIMYGDQAQLMTEAGMPGFATGFFNANPVENFALMPVTARGYEGFDPVETLRHEYTHYFMTRHLGNWQPGWFMEGAASFFETAHRGPDGAMRYGAAPPQIVGFLNEVGGMRFDDLERSSRSFSDTESMGRFYAKGWLITSHRYLGGKHSSSIAAYLDAKAKGAKTDTSLFADGTAQFDQDLEDWLAAGIPPEKAVAIPPADASLIRLRPMTAGEVALVGMRLELYRQASRSHSFATGVKAQEELLAHIRKIVAEHPGDRVVGAFSIKILLAIDSGHIGAAELEALLDPAGTTADDRILRARVMTRGADEGPPAQFQGRIAAARKILDGVLREDPDNVDALFATFENIREDEGASDAAITYLAKALAIDPHNGLWRMELLELYLRDGRKTDAIALLRPIVNLPHGGLEVQEAVATIRSLGGL
ncbi:hypothetical protein GCM10009115_31630 [Sphingopyxis soli]|uniref:DUF1570 domain-containing protein n=1 Tax=Sphingopyxis soli TaxID=592051 RepID=A0ABP3XMH4_9SPHN|nr:tetratricopeptide repeat protein [Sphingopyxis soli]